VSDLDLHGRLLNGLLPEEWWSQWLSPGKRRLRDLAIVLLFAVPVALALRRRTPAVRRAAVFLAAPLGIGIALMTAGLLVGNWDFFYPRYLAALLPPFGLFAAVAIGANAGPRAVARVAAGATVLVAGSWAALATVTPFSP
jgi:hypothetical protein